MDFLNNQILMFTSKKYEDIYLYFREKYNIKYQELFLISACIGFVNGCKKEVETRSREFRSNYFNTQQRSIAYSIILSDDSLGKNIERFDEKDFHNKGKSLLEEYAEGGMEILTGEVFNHFWDGLELDREYNEYEIDLLSYIYTNHQSIPF